MVGVAQPGFRYPLDGPQPDVWVPLHGQMDRDAVKWRSLLPYRSAIARLRPGVSQAQAQSELDVIHARLARLYPVDDGSQHFAVLSFHEAWVSGEQTPLLVLLGAVGFVLLIACANLANLQLARTATRRRELAIRTALGAGRGRIARQLLTECLLLAGLGSALGLLAAWLVKDALVAAIPAAIARLHPIALDGRVLLFTLALAAGTGILVGLAPALQVGRADFRATLAESGRGSSSGRGRVRAALLITEIALAMVLLVGAGLLVRSFAAVTRIDPGFRTDALLTARIRTGALTVSYDTLYRQLLDRTQALPGIDGVTLAARLPFSGWLGGSLQITLDDRPAPPPGTSWWAGWNAVSPGYLRTLGIPLLQGRDFQASDDTAQAPQVAIVNQSFVRRHFPQGNPIGRRILAYGQFDWRIVGVVADTLGGECPAGGCAGYGQGSLERAAAPELYTPFGRRPGGPDLYVALRLSAPDQQAPATALRALVRDIDPNLPLEEIRTMDDAIAGSLAPRRLIVSLLGLFAALALMLAVVGIYGVISYAVSQRTRELAIRMALGARGAQVLAMVVGHGLRIGIVGLGIGIGAGLVLTRVLTNQLYGVSATDPTTFAALAALVLAVSIAASWLPARRATRIDPMAAMRSE